MTDDLHGNKSHGKDTNYRNDDRWKHYNPYIFDKLKKRIDNGERNVKYLKQDNVVYITDDFSKPLPDNEKAADYPDKRKQWHLEAKASLKKCDLIFFQS